MEEKYWAAVDWSDDEHVVSIVDDERKKVKTFAVDHTDEGLDRMADRLRKFVPLAGVAIELNRGLVVQKLLDERLTVYPINPKLSKKWRDAQSVNGCKSDPGDAFVMATGLQRYHEQLRSLEPEDPLTRQLTGLCTTECRFIRTHTVFVQQLKACLKRYYPQALEWFDDWTGPTPLDFLKQFPTPERLRKATKSKLIGFLKTHHLRLLPKWQQKIDRRADDTWPHDQATTSAGKQEALGLVKMLRQAKQCIKQQRQAIRELFQLHPDAHIFDSLPGVGERLAPRLLGHFGTNRDRFPDARPLQQLSGTAPITRGSGKSYTVRIRRGCQKDFRNAMHWVAKCSINTCSWARAFYDKCRAAGDHDALALRKLANRWLKIIFCMWRDRRPYDEAKYLESLIKRGSPLLRYMQS
ncbi:MAG: IS110 family transposase [Planctomycetes bacterium]|nr:IS110 family transposase [Planctomycetota bacterium]